MEVERRIERPYRVRFDEAGPDGFLRSSGFLRYAQDLAWVHSETAGFNRDWYRERRLTWLVRAVQLDILDNVPYGAEINVSTEVIGFRRVWARRRSEFDLPGTERNAAVAIIDWVLLNARGAPTRIPREIIAMFVDPGAEFTPLRLDLPTNPAGGPTFEIAVRRSELDPMAHVNNAAYVDYLDERVLAGTSPRASLAVPRRYRAEFVSSAEPQAILTGRTWTDSAGRWYRLTDGDGREMLRARVETDPASWVGG